MFTPTTEFTGSRRRPDEIERLMAQGVPLCRIEEMLDEMEYEAARHVASLHEQQGWMGHLLWS
jgi:hypothetical protein